MKTKTITVTAGVTRSRDYQTVRYELSERAITHIAGKGMGAD